MESSNKSIYPRGQQILPTGEYRKYLDNINPVNDHEFKSIIEDSLKRVQGYDRRDSLFLFHELKDALIFSSKIFKGYAVIYKVTVEHCHISYRGDMNTLDVLSYAINCGIHESDSEIFDNLCRRYWKCGKTFSPCYEYLVKRAIVLNLLCDTKDCKQFHSEYINNQSETFLSVERTSIYVVKLNELRCNRH